MSTGDRTPGTQDPTRDLVGPRAARKSRRPKVPKKQQRRPTAAEQLDWLALQAAPQRKLATLRSRAEAEAHRYAGKFFKHRRETEIRDELASLAAQAALNRVSRRIEQRGPIEEEGAGLPGYFRRTLLNEVDRRLARHARGTVRGQLRRIGPGEALTVDIASPEPGAGDRPAAATIEVTVWAYRYHQRIITEAEQRLGRGSLQVDYAGESFAIKLGERQAPKAVLRLGLAEATRMRVHNTTVAGLHVRIVITESEFNSAGSTSLPRTPLDTQKGYGLEKAAHAGHRHVHDEGRRLLEQPAAALLAKLDPEADERSDTPHRIAVREIAPCDATSLDTAAVHEDVRTILRESPVAGTTDRPLNMGLAPSIALEVWNEVTAGSDNTGELLCRLADWDAPGLHAPPIPPDAHRGGHPLAEAIRRSVAALDVPYDISTNTVDQRRRRLRNRAGELLAGAAHQIHKRQFTGIDGSPTV